MRGRTGWLAALAMAVLIPQAGDVQAATFEVTRTGDPPPGACSPRDCSLREAVLAANASVGVADRILVPNGRRPYRLTRNGAGEDGALTGDLDLANDPVRILHPGRGRATIDAEAAADRVFDMFERAALRKLILTGGVPASGENGGAIEAHTDLSVSRSVLRGNTAPEFGGAVSHESGTLRVLGSKLVGNTALDEAGAINGNGTKLVIKRSTLRGNSAQDSQGGAIYSSTNLVVSDSTFANNTTVLRGGAIAVDSGQATISGSTFSGNRAVDDGGAISNQSGNAAIWNSTFSGNRARANGGAIWNGGNLALNGVTVARNVSNSDSDLSGGAGGGLFNSPAALVEIGNTILALNDQRSGDADDCSGTFASAGGNLRTDGTDCAGFADTGDAIRANPKLGPLTRNGGPTQTIALRRGSPAIGRAIESFATFSDQRGVRRDPNPDSGAYER